MRIVVTSALALVGLLSAGLRAQSSDGAGAKLPFRVALGTQFGLLSNVPDLRYRREVYEDIFGERKGVPAERYRLLTQNFNLDFLLQNEGGYSSAFQVALGFRQTMGSPDPAGSEFSGFRLAHKQSILSGRILASLGYGLLRSDFLRLAARHHEFRVRFDYVPDPTSLDPAKSPFFVRVGPELIAAVPTGEDRADRYGLQWAVHALVRFQGAFGEDLPASLGLQGLFRRISNFTLDGQQEGGAGVLSLSPVTELMVVENLWLGLRMDVPVLRPEGREEAFSDPEIPGLYGNAYSLFLRTATF
jgi:hypothetical protein